MKYIDVQGHRGCRGLYPENTIQAFKHALELGVTTLELDVVTSKNDEIIVSHEPFFSHLISMDPKGDTINETDEHAHNIFQMDSQEIKRYDVGLKTHPNFPDQLKIAAHKPSLSELVKELEAHFSEPIFYNIELKRKPEWDNRFTAPVERFVSSFVKTIKDLGIENQLSVQSFDVECLHLLKQSELHAPLVFLVENKLSFEENVEKLSFVPEFYSPYYKFVDSTLVNKCKAKQMKIIPWTVNDIATMKALISLDVDGIITDYPDRLIELINSMPDVQIK